MQLYGKDKTERREDITRMDAYVCVWQDRRNQTHQIGTTSNVYMNEHKATRLNFVPTAYKIQNFHDRPIFFAPSPFTL